MHQQRRRLDPLTHPLTAHLLELKQLVEIPVPGIDLDEDVSVHPLTL